MRKVWELHITRGPEQIRNGKRRTPGKYKVLHNGVPMMVLSGSCAETRGPGDNSTEGNKRCIEPGKYPLATQDGPRYVTIGYTSNLNPAKLRRPALLLTNTGHRGGILLHPARGFLWSVGCINLAAALSSANANIDFIDSRKRVIAVIDDLASFLGSAFPETGGTAIPGASIVIS